MINSFSDKLIADRYELTKNTRFGYQAPQTESFVAYDRVLSRQLRAILIQSDHPNCARAFDGARRASLFNDPQSVSIISIEDAPECTAIFTEFPLGVQLSEVLKARNTAVLDDAERNNDSIDSETTTISSASSEFVHFVHTVMGQFSRVINNARHFGLRCLHLDSATIYLTDSDQVIVDGLGIIASLYGAVLDRSSEELDRAEARGLVVFLASLLLSRDFPANPDEHDSIVSQAYEQAIQQHYPQQLIDVLSAEIHGHGPQSAGDFMRLLAPWDDCAISLYLSYLRNNNFLSTDDDLIGNTGDAENGENGEKTLSPVDPATSRPFIQTPEWRKIHENADSNHEIADSQIVTDIKIFDTAKNTDSVDCVNSAESTDSADSVDGKNDLSDANDADVSASDVNVAKSEISLQDQDIDDTADSADLSVESDNSAENSSPDISTIVLLIFLGLITLALIFGFWRTLQPLGNSDFGLADLASSSAESTKKQTPKNQESQAPTPHIATPAVIKSVELISSDANLLDPADPNVAKLKDGLPRLFDNNPSTRWSTWWFARPEVYERSKLGLVVTLQEETEISEVSLVTRSTGGKLQWKSLSDIAAVTGNSALNADIVAEADFSEEISLKSTKPVKTKKFVLWIDAIPKTGNENRAEFAEISLK